MKKKNNTFRILPKRDTFTYLFVAAWVFGQGTRSR